MDAQMSVKVTEITQNGDFGCFSGLSRLLGLVISSNLVQTAFNTYAELCGVLRPAITHSFTHKTLNVSVKVTVWRFFGHKSTCRARYWFKLGVECM